MLLPTSSQGITQIPIATTAVAANIAQPAGFQMFVAPIHIPYANAPVAAAILPSASLQFTGLFKQYANMLLPRMP